jgi:ketosteroid isomerase-like protein
MAPANLDLVRSIGAAWVRGDYSQTDWAHPDIAFVIADGPAPGSWRGLAGMAEGWRSFLSAWEEFHGDRVDELRELDDEHVLMFHSWAGRGKSSGLELEQMPAKAATLFQIRGGKVSRLIIYFDRERAIADLGLPQEAGPSQP